MVATNDHYDVIVIGSGPGGASLAHRLAPTGKRILMLERGGYLPRSRRNWDSKAVFVDAIYQAKETWYGGDGSAFHPGLHYFVGGNSKVYGAALFRLRERDFQEVRFEVPLLRADGSKRVPSARRRENRPISCRSILAERSA